MGKVSCAQVRQWIEEGMELKRPIAPDARRQAHLAACPRCRGALLLLAADTLGPGQTPPTISCERCQDDLPAFVEREVFEDAAAARRAYPHVWLHLWTCAECLETYLATRALVLAEQRGELALPPVLTMPAQNMSFRLLTLERSFLNIALPRPTAALGAPRGGGVPQVIAESKPGAAPRATLSVQELPHAWRVRVDVAPAPQGSLRLTLGDALFQAQFDAGGAVVDVPARLLLEDNGPDLLVDLEPARGGETQPS